LNLHLPTRRSSAAGGRWPRRRWRRGGRSRVVSWSSERERVQHVARGFDGRRVRCPGRARINAASAS
jgi:hypothetical protein